MKDFDIIIPIAKNDMAALQNSLPYIVKQLPKCQIFIIANRAIEENFSAFPEVKFIDENTMLNGIDFSLVKQWIGCRYAKAERRTGWYFQQFLKLGYARICEKEFYLSWDSDTIPVTGLDFFHNDVPFLDVLPLVKEDSAYEKTINRLWTNGKISKKAQYSFITEHMMFNTQIVKDMLAEIEENATLTGCNFAQKIINTIPREELNLSGFSEFETYAAYALSINEASYELRDWKNLRHGKVYFGSTPTEKQLAWASDVFNVVSIEDFDHQWWICKVICSENNVYRVSFIKVYKLLEPLIIVSYRARLLIRRIIRR